jgi:hypothetical protein
MWSGIAPPNEELEDEVEEAELGLPRIKPPYPHEETSATGLG